MDWRDFGKRVLAVTVAVMLAACVGEGSPSKMASKPDHVTAVAPVSEAKLRLISRSQYVHSLNQIFGDDIVVKARFAPVTRVDGLVGVGASTVVLTGGGIDPLESTARAVAQQVVDPLHRQYLIPCTPANPKARDDMCARAFFAKTGRLLYRRLLTDKELTKAVTAAGEVIGPTVDFYAGISYVLAGMLTSPRFLYIWEKSEPDPAQPGTYRLDGYSKASRLSLLLWDSAPDDELLQAAERGELHTSVGLERQLNRMMASASYKDGVRAFFDDFFVMEAFDTLTKDPTIYPAFTLKVVSEAREQLLRTVVDHLVTRHGDYRDLYTTRRTYLSSDLGVLYRMAVVVGAQGFVPYEFPSDSPRAGILSQIAFLSQYAHEGRSSATRRGRAIREVVLCQKVPDPPPNVDFSKFQDPKNAATARERLASHTANPVCAGCHRVTDPIGLALENFDGAGQFRTTDNGSPIDPSGTLDGHSFTNTVDFAKVVRDSEALKSCIVKRLYSYSLGRTLTPEEQSLLKEYEAVLDKKGYRFDEMLRLFVLDKTFFEVKPPNKPTPAAVVSSAATGGANAN